MSVRVIIAVAGIGVSGTSRGLFRRDEREERYGNVQWTCVSTVAQAQRY
jgi:hypothetical protein